MKEKVPRQTVADVLRKIRSDLGLTQRQAGELFGVPENSIRQWEAKRRPIPGPAFKFLCFIECFHKIELASPGGKFHTRIPYQFYLHGVSRQKLSKPGRKL